MFDVSFSELLLILFVGLLVFGPEKLPQVIRTVSLWISRARRTFHQIRTEIEREAGVDELKRDLHNQSIMDSLQDVHNDLRQTQRELENLPYDVDDIVQRNLGLNDDPESTTPAAMHASNPATAKPATPAAAQAATSTPAPTPTPTPNIATPSANQQS